MYLPVGHDETNFFLFPNSKFLCARKGRLKFKKNYFQKAFNFEKPHKFQKLSSETCEFKNIQNSNNSGFFSQGSFEGPFRVYFWGPFESLFVGLFRAKQRSLLFLHLWVYDINCNLNGRWTNDGPGNAAKKFTPFLSHLLQPKCMNDVPGRVSKMFTSFDKIFVATVFLAERQKEMKWLDPVVAFATYHNHRSRQSSQICQISDKMRQDL